MRAELIIPASMGSGAAAGWLASSLYFLAFYSPFGAYWERSFRVLQSLCQAYATSAMFVSQTNLSGEDFSALHVFEVLTHAAVAVVLPLSVGRDAFALLLGTPCITIESRRGHLMWPGVPEICGADVVEVYFWLAVVQAVLHGTLLTVRRVRPIRKAFQD